MTDTIPGLFTAAVDRDPGGTWLRTDDGTLTFGGAAAHVAGLVERLRDSGVRPDDPVVVTARTTPSYVLCWLALASLGAVSVPTDPASTVGELAGLLGQVRPRAVVTDASSTPLVQEASSAASTTALVLDIDDLLVDWRVEQPPTELPVDRDLEPGDVAVLIPTSGTTGRSKLVMQTHRAYAMAGEGFPWWMELTSADRLMTSLPLFHINAPAYSVLGSLAAGAGLVLLPRFSARGFLDSARRHGATEFNAIGAMLEILMRQPPRPDDAETDLRLCYTGPSPAREWQEAFEARFGLRVVCGYAMSESPYGLIWRHGTRPFGTLGSPGSTRRSARSTRFVSWTTRAASSGRGRPASCCCATRPSHRATGRCPRRPRRPSSTAGCTPATWSRPTTTTPTRSSRARRRCSAVVARTFLLLEVEEAITTHPDVLEAAVVAVPSELTEDEVKAFVVARRGRSLDFETSGPGRRSGSRRSRSRGSGRPSMRSRGPRHRGWPSTGSR